MIDYEYDTMAGFYDILDSFLSSSLRNVMCLYGGTGSERMYMVRRYFHHQCRGVRPVYVSSYLPHVHYRLGKMMTWRHFCYECIIRNSYPKNYDVLILDDFHIHSLERQVVLLGWLRKQIPYSKLIIISPVLVHYHFKLIESYTNTKEHDVYKYDFDRASVPEMFHKDKDVQIEYKDYIQNENYEITWEFDSKTHISFINMCLMIDSILDEMEDPNLERSRILVYVQSPEMCDMLAEHYHSHSSFYIDTIHGQKPKKEIYRILSSRSIQIIFSTNIRWNPEYVYTNLIDAIIDFGVAYSKTEYGFLCLGYCSQSELHNRTHILTRGKVYRIMSKQFYENQPYIETPIFDWRPFLLQCIIHNKLDYFIEWLPSGHSPSTRVGYVRNIFQDIYNLVKCHILQHDFKINNFHFEKSKMIRNLVKTPFSVEMYSIISHLYHIHHVSCVPDITLCLSTMMISLIDTIAKHGRHRIFDLPRITNRAPSYVFDNWLRVLLFCNGESYGIDTYFISNRQKLLWLTFELYLTILIRPTGYTFNIYNIQSQTWNDFVRRWQILYQMITSQSAAMLSQNDFLQQTQSKIQQYTITREWSLQHGTYPHYLFKNYRLRRPTRELRGTFYYLRGDIKESLLNTMWKLSDYSTWTHNLHPHHRKMLLHDELQEPYITIDSEHQLYLPFPNHVLRYLDSFRNPIVITVLEAGEINDIQTESSKRDARITQKQLLRNHFRRTVVDQIDCEVAFRPLKYKYYEVMNDFEYHRNLLVQGSPCTV